MSDKVSVEIEASSELSVDNVLAQVRLRSKLEWLLTNYEFSDDFTNVTLEFSEKVEEPKVKKPSKIER